LHNKPAFARFVNVPEADLTELCSRINATKWPERETVTDASQGVQGVVVPTAVSVFPDELYPAPRAGSERAYPKLIQYSKVDKGGRFAAWEQPQLFSEELRAGFRSLR
jgi:hypothetical protein